MAASISGLCSSSHRRHTSSANSAGLPKHPISNPTRFPLPLKPSRPLSIKAVARQIPTPSNSDDPPLVAEHSTPIKDPRSLWSRYADWLYQHRELGLYLDVSRIGFTPRFVDQTEPRFRMAFRHMEELENGAVANPDERRMVGHYWLRNTELAPNPSLSTQIQQTLDSVCEFADDVVSGKIRTPSGGRFTQILSVGIGGSALGPQFVAEALAPHNPPLKIRFIDNTDPAGIDHQIAQLGPELASTLVIVTSKSGGTPETRNGLLEVQKAFREAGLEFAMQGVAITQENSLLDNTARLEEISMSRINAGAFIDFS